MDLTEEALMARNYTPPINYTISEWVELVNTGFLIGQHFFINDMQNQQEANDAQMVLSLSAGEQEDTVFADQEFAEQLDKEMNATPQRCSSQCKKVTPQKKMPTKPAGSKQKQVSKPSSRQQVSNPALKEEVLNSDVKDFLKTELISAVQNAMESLVNIARAVITKDLCHAVDLPTSKEGQAALEKLNNFGNILLCEHLEISLMKKP